MSADGVASLASLIASILFLLVVSSGLSSIIRHFRSPQGIDKKTKNTSWTGSNNRVRLVSIAKDDLDVLIETSLKYQTAKSDLDNLNAEYQRLLHEADALREALRGGGKAPQGDEASTMSSRSARDILDLNENVRLDARTLRAAYLAAVKRAHPDGGGTAEDFMRVQDAYTFLKNEINTGK